MYRELVFQSGLYDDFGFEDGQFDPVEFVDIEGECIGMDSDDVVLLHEGAFIKIICNVLQAWSQGGFPQTVTSTIYKYKELLLSERLDHIPELKLFLAKSLNSIDEESAWDGADAIYQKYVVGYFKKLLS